MSGSMLVPIGLNLAGCFVVPFGYNIEWDKEKGPGSRGVEEGVAKRNKKEQ